MKALITGGAGFIGYNLCLKLDQFKWDTTVVDDYSSGHRSNRVPNARYHDASILDQSFIDELFQDNKFDVVFHLAAIPRVPYSVEHPVKTTHANVIGTLNLLDAIRQHSPSTKFIFSSSSSIYGSADVLPTPESSPFDPKSPYAMQKAQSEMWCKLYAELYGLDTLILRYFNVFGRFSRYGGPYTTVLGAWMHSLFVDASAPAILYGEASRSRDFCFVDNVVDANLSAAVSPVKFTGQALNIAQGEQHTLQECKELLELISGEKLELVMEPSREGDVMHTLADISAARELIGYHPFVDFESQVRTMANWYEKEYSREVASALLKQAD